MDNLAIRDQVDLWIGRHASVQAEFSRAARERRAEAKQRRTFETTGRATVFIPESVLAPLALGGEIRAQRRDDAAVRESIAIPAVEKTLR
jgi:hypothetical protein